MIKHLSLLLFMGMPGLLFGQDAFVNNIKDKTCSCITEYIGSSQSVGKEVLQTAMRDCFVAVLKQNEKELEKYLKKQKIEARELGQQAGAAMVKECKALASLAEANTDTDAKYDEARKLMQAGNHEKAQKLLTELISSNPTSALYFNDRGVSRESLGDVWGGLADYRRAIDLEPAYALAYYNLGNLLYGQEYYSDAILFFKKSTVLNPNDGDHWAGVLKAFYQTGQYDSVQYFAKKALAVDSKNVAVYNYKGLVHFQQEDYAAALTQFQQVTALDPSSVLGWQNMAGTQVKLGQGDKAVATYKRYLKEVDAKSRAIREDLADLLLSQEKWAEAETLYQQLNKEEQELRLQHQLGRLYLAKKDFKKANQWYEQLLKINPEEPALLYNRVLAMLEVGESEKAISVANKLLELQPKDAENYDLRASVWEKLNKPDKALEDLAQSLLIFPKDAKVYVRRGDLYRKMGKEADACNAYRMALAWDEAEGTKALSSYCK